MGDFSPSLINADEIHKIGLLDIRILNVDRNEGNILVTFPNKESLHSKSSIGFPGSYAASCLRSGAAILTPIDHGYCIPNKIQVDSVDWCWFLWKQARESFSEKTKKFVEAIDVDADAQALKKLLSIDDASLRSIRITGRLMKIGVREGLNLFEIAELVARDDVSQPSRLELTVTEGFNYCRSLWMEIRVMCSLATATKNALDDHLKLQVSSCSYEYMVDRLSDVRTIASTQIISTCASSSEAASYVVECAHKLPANLLQSLNDDVDVPFTAGSGDADLLSLGKGMCATARESESCHGDCCLSLEGDEFSVSDEEEDFTYISSYYHGGEREYMSRKVNGKILNDIQFDELWCDPDFEKEFYRHLELLLERDVADVLSRREISR